MKGIPAGHGYYVYPHVLRPPGLTRSDRSAYINQEVKITDRGHHENDAQTSFAPVR